MPKLPIRPRRKPQLTLKLILGWADAFHDRHGRWPHLYDGEVEGVPGQTWAAADRALTVGNRGLPGGTTLAKLLLARRGRRHMRYPPELSVEGVLAWADAHHTRTGDWPSGSDRGQVRGGPRGTTWVAIEIALQRGKRGLPSGSSIAQLLADHRGVRNRMAVPDLSPADILAWADACHARTGRWPKYQDGPIADAPGETWAAVDTALLRGHRGLSGDSSLAKFLAEHRGVRNRSALPHLVVERIAEWAVVHKNRTGRWPTTKSREVADAPGETWGGIHQALRVGQRGLPGGSSLADVVRRVEGMGTEPAAG
jgi:hypothetical protein